MGPSAVDWRSSLSFSERLQAVLRIRVALLASSGENAAADAQIKAKAVENEVFKSAASLDLYHACIQQHIHAIESVTVQSAALQNADLSDDVEQFLSAGITIGDYVNAQHYKDGHFSAVYRAKSLKSCPLRDNIWKGGFVALKATHPSSLPAPHDSRREARILAAAASKHVVPLLETFMAKDGQYVLVFPFLPVDLEGLLRNGPLPEARGKRIVKDISSALVHIHGKGMIHRDIKPSNILLRQPNGPAYLADFGIAWWRDDPTSESSNKKILDVGTTCYRPPELMFGNERYGPSLDMWALGCVAAQVFDLGNHTLFDSGELGSDLALIKSIFETLGTPTLELWPEAATFPDWGKMAFTEYPPQPWSKILSRASEEAIDFVAALVRYQSQSRLIAAQSLDHPFLTSA